MEPSGSFMLALPPLVLLSDSEPEAGFLSLIRLEEVEPCEEGESLRSCTTMVNTTYNAPKPKIQKL